MAENKDEQLTDEELAQLQLAEENENAVDRLVKELGCPTRRIRQFAARVLHLLAERDPESAAVIHPHNVRRVIRALEMMMTVCRMPSRSRNSASRASVIMPCGLV